MIGNLKIQFTGENLGNSGKNKKKEIIISLSLPSIKILITF
jgi:hypothetical protein